MHPIQVQEMIDSEPVEEACPSVGVVRMHSFGMRFVDWHLAEVRLQDCGVVEGTTVRVDVVAGALERVMVWGH